MMGGLIYAACSWSIYSVNSNCQFPGRFHRLHSTQYWIYLQTDEAIHIAGFDSVDGKNSTRSELDWGVWEYKSR